MIGTVDVYRASLDRLIALSVRDTFERPSRRARPAVLAELSNVVRTIIQMACPPGSWWTDISDYDEISIVETA